MDINKNEKIFGMKKMLIGMIHVPALPGTPFNKMNPKQIIEKTILEAKIFNNIKYIHIDDDNDDEDDACTIYFHVIKCNSIKANVKKFLLLFN